MQHCKDLKWIIYWAQGEKIKYIFTRLGYELFPAKIWDGYKGIVGNDANWKVKALGPLWLYKFNLMGWGILQKNTIWYAVISEKSSIPS